MKQRDYYLPADVPVGTSIDSDYLEADLSAYKSFCSDLLTYIHTLEARIAKLEHTL